MCLKTKSKDLDLPNLAAVRPDLEIPSPTLPWVGRGVGAGVQANLRFLLKFSSCASVLLLSALGRKPLSDGDRALRL